MTCTSAVPLPYLCVRRYTRGDMAAIVPNYNYMTVVDDVMSTNDSELDGNNWRQARASVCV